MATGTPAPAEADESCYEDYVRRIQAKKVQRVFGGHLPKKDKSATPAPAEDVRASPFAAAPSDTPPPLPRHAASAPPPPDDTPPVLPRAQQRPPPFKPQPEPCAPAPLVRDGNDSAPPVLIECPHCHTPTRADHKFCGSCGAECARCGHCNSAVGSLAFCAVCGEPQKLMPPKALTKSEAAGTAPVENSEVPEWRRKLLDKKSQMGAQPKVSSVESSVPKAAEGECGGEGEGEGESGDDEEKKNKKDIKDKESKQDKQARKRQEKEAKRKEAETDKDKEKGRDKEKDKDKGKEKDEDKDAHKGKEKEKSKGKGKDKDDEEENADEAKDTKGKAKGVKIETVELPPLKVSVRKWHIDDSDVKADVVFTLDAHYEGGQNTVQRKPARIKELAGKLNSVGKKLFPGRPKTLERADLDAYGAALQAFLDAAVLDVPARPSVLLWLGFAPPAHAIADEAAGEEPVSPRKSHKGKSPRFKEMLSPRRK